MESTSFSREMCSLQAAPSSPFSTTRWIAPPVNVPRLARIGQLHAAGVRRALRELDTDEHGGRDEENGEDSARVHRISLHAEQRAAAANAAARKNAERNARVIVS